MMSSVCTDIGRCLYYDVKKQAAGKLRERCDLKRNPCKSYYPHCKIRT